MDLRPEYYTTALEAERNLIACILVDRKLMHLDRVLRIRPEYMIDIVSAEIMAKLQRDPFTPLSKLVVIGWDEIAKAVCDSFWWHAEWYASEVLRLTEMRLRLIEVEDFILEHCE